MGNRSALLEAAVLCLRERGYGRTRARDLCATAGVSLGAIRYHFGSTEALLNEAIMEGVRRWIERFAGLVAAHRAEGPVVALHAIADEFYDVLAAHRPYVVGFVEALAQAERSAELRTQLADCYEEFRGSVGSILDPEGTGADTGQLTSMLLAFVDGLLIQWLLDPDRAVDPESLKRAVSGLLTALG